MTECTFNSELTCGFEGEDDVNTWYCRLCLMAKLVLVLSRIKLPHT